MRVGEVVLHTGQRSNSGCQHLRPSPGPLPIRPLFPSRWRLTAKQSTASPTARGTELGEGAKPCNISVATVWTTALLVQTGVELTLINNCLFRLVWRHMLLHARQTHSAYWQIITRKPLNATQHPSQAQFYPLSLLAFRSKPIYPWLRL